MYDRNVNGRVLSFGHAGILVNRSFVMYDRQTNSLWVHVTGRAEQGPLKGQMLRFLPSTVTTWEQWKARFPQTKVLPGHRRGGFMGTFNGMRYIESFGLSVTIRFKAKLYPYETIRRQGIVNDRFNGEALVVYYSQRGGTATAWNSKLDGRTLTFSDAKQRDEFGNALLIDNQTKSHWSWLTGESVSGTLKGRKLDRLAYNPILTDRFKSFYPDAPIFQ